MGTTGPPTLGPWWTSGSFCLLLPPRPCTKPASTILTGLDNGNGKFLNFNDNVSLDGPEFSENSGLVYNSRLKHNLSKLHLIILILMVLSLLQTRTSVNFALTALSSMGIRDSVKNENNTLQKSKTLTLFYSLSHIDSFPFSSRFFCGRGLAVLRLLCKGRQIKTGKSFLPVQCSVSESVNPEMSTLKKIFKKKTQHLVALPKQPDFPKKKKKKK